MTHEHMEAGMPRLWLHVCARVYKLQEMLCLSYTHHQMHVCARVQPGVDKLEEACVCSACQSRRVMREHVCVCR